jgi:2-polyprenyl-3-methyl-5-hydroxy-6-metoxy-1,4-benzoquinol methylase
VTTQPPKRTSVAANHIATSVSDFAPSLGDPSATRAAYAFAHQQDVIRQLIIDRKLRAICEVGGGRSPLFAVDDVAELDLDYTVLDVSAAELALASSHYTKVIGDICSLRSDDSRIGSYDLVFSHMLAEHVSSGEAMHRNIFRLLRPGGIAFHFFPTLFSPAFVANKLLPEWMAQWTLRIVYRGRQHYEKFPAKYSWCYGPSPRRNQKFMALGYTVLDYRPFYGTEYLQFLPGARQLEQHFHNMAAKRHSRLFTSYAWLILLKPAGPHGQLPAIASGSHRTTN